MGTSVLDDDAKLALRKALTALQEGDVGGWNALAPLSQLSAQGTDISIDFTTEPLLGAPVIIARPAARPLALTPRQAQVAQALAQGLTNKAIARALGISPATVKDHVQDILSTLGLTSRSQIAAAWVRSQTG